MLVIQQSSVIIAMIGLFTHHLHALQLSCVNERILPSLYIDDTCPNFGASEYDVCYVVKNLRKFEFF